MRFTFSRRSDIRACCVAGLSRVRCWDYCGEAPVVKAALSGRVHTCGRGTVITRSHASGRKTRRLLAGTLLLPLALMALGIWEGYRGAADVAAATLQRDRLAPVVEALQASAEKRPAQWLRHGIAVPACRASLRRPPMRSPRRRTSCTASTAPFGWQVCAPGFRRSSRLVPGWRRPCPSWPC